MVARPRWDTAVAVTAWASTGSDELETKDNPMSRYELYARRYPLLPLKNVVIFPRNVITLLIGRTRSISAIEEAWARDRRIVVTAHRIPDADEPRPEDLYSIGTIAEVPEPRLTSPEARALVGHVHALADGGSDLKGKLSAEVLEMIKGAEDPAHLADLLATQLLAELPDRQAILEQLDPIKRLVAMAIRLTGELDMLALEQ